MPSAILVQVSTPVGTTVKGVTTDVSGHAVEISVLSAAAQRLDTGAEIQPGAPVEMVFHSPRHGPSPPIRGLVRAATQSKQSMRLSVEITDWDKLARFWEGVRRR